MSLTTCSRRSREHSLHHTCEKHVLEESPDVLEEFQSGYFLQAKNGGRNFCHRAGSPNSVRMIKSHVSQITYWYSNSEDKIEADNEAAVSASQAGRPGLWSSSGSLEAAGSQQPVRERPATAAEAPARLSSL